MLLVLDVSVHYVQCVPYAAILQIFLLFSMILYCRIQLPAVYKQRDVRWCSFRWSIPLSIGRFAIPLLIGLSRLLHGHIAYKIDTAKIIAAFFQISYWLHDFIRLNSIVCHAQTTRCTMMRFTLIHSDIKWLCLRVDIHRAISTLSYSCSIWNSYIKKSPLIIGLMRETISQAGL